MASSTGSPQHFIRSPAEWIPLPGALAGHRSADPRRIRRRRGNQPVWRRARLVHAETLDEIHRTMTAAIEAEGGKLAGIFVCPHAPEANCDCRKPRPGLMRQIETAFGRQSGRVSRSWAILSGTCAPPRPSAPAPSSCEPATGGTQRRGSPPPKSSRSSTTWRRLPPALMQIRVMLGSSYSPCLLFLTVVPYSLATMLLRPLGATASVTAQRLPGHA